jgi:diguanylate cyclase (GGDEF)-like protein
LYVNTAAALGPTEAAELLSKAESIKTSNYPEFVTTLKLLGDNSSELSAAQQVHLRFLNAWQTAYLGEYERAVSMLNATIAEAQDTTLRFRARATMVNMLSIAKYYKDAYLQLNLLLEELPQVSDSEARQQGLGATAIMYNQVEQYDLGLHYADELAKENPVGRSACIAKYLKAEALLMRPDPRPADADFQAGIDLCVQVGEPVFANLIRIYVAKLQIGRHQFATAIELLREHYDEVGRTRYPLLISGGDALLSQAYQQTGNPALARQHALHAIESAVKNEYTMPLVTAYRMLYTLAKEQGDSKAALAYYEKYATADKAYLDNVSARQLGYQRVKQEVDANKLQIEALNKQNQLLQLQQALDQKAIENTRLYVALLIIVLGFIAFWAFRTKRSQLHFMNLSRRDGLTGICNRPHFIELAESALENHSRTQQEVCVVLCDLDYFKAINDRYGHAQGDSILKQTVTACQPHLGAADIFARVGGEEFCILLPGCNADAACQRAEQIRSSIAAIGQAVMKSSISASFGIATTTSSGYELRQLMAHADLALYQAKRTGRNRVEVYDAQDALVLLNTGTFTAISPKEMQAY